MIFYYTIIYRMSKNNYLVVGTDGSNKSLYASVFDDIGTPVQSNMRCCDTMPYDGTPKEDLSSEPQSISGYGLPHYSQLNKCFKINKKDTNNINYEMTKNNLNTEEIYDSIYKKKVFKPKKNLLGEDVISYRILNKKEKK